MDDLGDFAPFTGPALKAMKIKAFVEDIAARREEREMRRQQFLMDLEDRARARKRSDFETVMELLKIGAMPGQSDWSQKNDDLIRGTLGIRPEDERQLIETPSGQKYRLPSQTDRAARYGRESTAKAQADAKAKIEGDRILEAEDKQSGKLVRLKIPALGKTFQTPVTPEREIWVDRENYVETLKKVRELKADVKSGKLTAERILEDEVTGDLVFVGIDEATRTPVEIPLKTKMSPKPLTGEQPIPDFDVKVKQRSDAWRDGFYAQLGITPEMVALSRSPAKQGLPKYHAAAQRIAAAEKELNRRVVEHLKNQNRGQRPAASAPAAGKSAAPPVAAPAKPGSTSGRAAPARKVGDRFMYQGKMVEVTGIENGQLKVKALE